MNLIHQRPSEFQAALDFTSAQTRFSARLIEKDYWCSLVLDALSGVSSPLVFKGGTLLGKAYANFDRLAMAKRKCEGYDLAECCSAGRKKIFERGIGTDLVPVLRAGMAEAFDFEAAWKVYSQIHGRITQQPD